MDPAAVETWVKVAIGVGSALSGGFTAWVLMRRDVADLKEWKREIETGERSERAAAEQRKEDARREAERQMTAWWEAIEELRKGQASLDKTCAVATGNLTTAMGALGNRVDLHTSTNLSAIIGLVKNYNEMLEESVAAHRAGIQALQMVIMKVRGQGE